MIYVIKYTDDYSRLGCDVTQYGRKLMKFLESVRKFDRNTRRHTPKKREILQATAAITSYLKLNTSTSTKKRWEYNILDEEQEPRWIAGSHTVYTECNLRSEEIKY